MVIFSKHKKTEKKGVNILGIKCFTFDLPTRRHLFPKLAASKTSGHRSKFHLAKPCTDGTAMGGEPPIVFGGATGWTVGSGSEASEMASEAADGGVGLFVGGALGWWEKGSWKPTHVWWIFSYMENFHKFPHFSIVHRLIWFRGCSKLVMFSFRGGKNVDGTNPKANHRFRM